MFSTTAALTRGTHISAFVATAVLIGGTLAVANSSRGATNEEADTEKAAPTLMAVKFHADWCGPCQRMKPVLEEVKGSYAESQVLFVTLDLTDKKSSHQAALLASALGLDELWAYNAGSTGRLFLVDASEKSIKDTITVAHSAEDIGEILDGLK
ncbi:MAG: thioredoxin family protein [Candidatus Sumerlaeia bacterium]|nr:thioredoxin family protein [Candidatus Sumerlaeia bacterium]